MPLYDKVILSVPLYDKVISISHFITRQLKFVFMALYDKVINFMPLYMTRWSHLYKVICPCGTDYDKITIKFVINYLQDKCDSHYTTYDKMIFLSLYDQVILTLRLIFTSYTSIWQGDFISILVYDIALIFFSPAQLG